ncbi:MAG: glycosyltransferase [Candidatus Limnocylindrales bacterium]
MDEVCAILAHIRAARSVIEVIGLGHRLADDARAVAGAGATGRRADIDVWQQALIEAIGETADAPTAIAATHALAQFEGPTSEERLRELLLSDGWLAAHAAWALADHSPAAELINPLLALVEDGQLAGMLGQQTLIRWARGEGDTTNPAATDRGSLARAVDARLRDATSTPRRTRLVETLGRVGGSTRRLAAIAADAAESNEARSAAIAALGDRDGAAVWTLQRISHRTDVLGDVARLALFDHGLREGRGLEPISDDLRIAQIHLGGRMDRELTHAGKGSTGGIATLLVQLGDALASDARVAAVTTVGRGSPSEAMASLAHQGGRGHRADAGAHAVIPAALAAGEDGSFAGAWPALVAAERSVRRILVSQRSNLLHLRMADVGSLAAARIARRLGLPIAFTLAPDPHALIADMERSGELNRANFGAADAASALWFRARLVRRLADASRQVALFPRPDLEGRLRELLSIDISADPQRYHVIAEGIDLTPANAARVQVARAVNAPFKGMDGAPPTFGVLGARGQSIPILGELRTALHGLGPDRLGRPLVVSVGRLAEVKGMSRIVEAFAGDPTLRARANLVVVGGDLADPSAEEQSELARINEVLARDPETARAVVLLGHRTHDDVLRVLAVAEAGLGPDIAPGGAYVCGSRKEEFGLAIVEALAVGLTVVAPRVGGPPSYVEEGITGRLVDTMNPAAIGAGLHDVLDLAPVSGRAMSARDLVATRFTIDAMARALVPVYQAARAAQRARSAAPAVGATTNAAPQVRIERAIRA